MAVILVSSFVFIIVFANRKKPAEPELDPEALERLTETVKAAFEKELKAQQDTHQEI